MAASDFPVKDLLEDPDLKAIGGFTIRRYVVTVDENGISARTYEDIHAEGVVVPSGSIGMERTAEVERQGDEITLYTETPISTGDASVDQPADDIIWHGQLWQVTGQDDYLDYNFNAATARLAELGGRPVAP